MASTASSTSKVCVQCGRDVTGAQRMRDSQGKYWCIACGEADQRKRKGSEGVTCAGCSKTFPASAITTVNLLPYCGKCAKKRKSASRESLFSRFSSSSDQIDKKRLVMMLAFMAVLAAVALYMWL
jgi:formylmethanofuran dehydrogenase subunit E